MNNRKRAICLTGTKICSKCKIEHPLDFFFNYHRGKFGKESKCKSCKREYQRAIKNNPEVKKRRSLKAVIRSRFKKYGLSQEDFNSMMMDQDYSCGICNISLRKEQIINTPHVDHCHTTGKVRGLLCPRCNTGLGSFRDNTDFLMSAISYLKDNNDF